MHSYDVCSSTVCYIAENWIVMYLGLVRGILIIVKMFKFKCWELTVFSKACVSIDCRMFLGYASEWLWVFNSRLILAVCVHWLQGVFWLCISVTVSVQFKAHLSSACPLTEGGFFTCASVWLWVFNSRLILAVRVHWLQGVFWLYISLTVSVQFKAHLSSACPLTAGGFLLVHQCDCECSIQGSS